MHAHIQQLSDEIANFRTQSPAEVEAFRKKFIARKGAIATLMAQLGTMPPATRKTMGALLNQLKHAAQQRFNALQQQLPATDQVATQLGQDLTLPPPAHELGTLHPLTIVRHKIVSLLENMGFNVSEGPEIEDDWHNFTALIFPENHPARDMQDTFFVAEQQVLRTHTSSVQVRVMETQAPPIRTLSPGRVFRKESISARAHCIFHQLEGLYIDRKVSFVDLKQTLLYFVKALFGSQTRLRFRPSYFPFTEPSAEVDIDCRLCGGQGCNVCKYTGWVEIMGAGMVDPQVLKNCHIDPQQYTGFAFGMGIERIAMLQYRVNDLRLFTENDIRFLKQFNDATA